MKVVGIDPGFANMGVVIADMPVGIEDVIFTKAGVIKTSPGKDLSAGEDLINRGQDLMNDLCYFIGEGSVYALCIEAFSRPPNVGSAIKLGASHGVLGAVARNYWPEIIYVETPQAVRKRVMGVAKGKTPPEDEVHAWLLARYPELDALMGGGRRHMLDAAAVVVAALNEGRLS